MIQIYPCLSWKVYNFVYNFSNYHLTDSAKSLLIKGLNFAIPPKKIDYSKFLLPFVFTITITIVRVNVQLT